MEYFNKYDINIKLETLNKNINKFEKLFRSNKISSTWGFGFNNGLILFCLVHYLNPQRILESGVWTGFTTMIFDNASKKNTSIMCCDINLSRNEYITDKAIYYEKDITEVPEEVKLNFDLAFDDHFSHYDRLLFCLENSIDSVILDDDVRIMTHTDGWPSIPLLL